MKQAQPIKYYVVEPREFTPQRGRICTAAVWSCALCGEIIDGLGGPGDGEICVKCGEDIHAGRLRYERGEPA